MSSLPRDVVAIFPGCDRSGEARGALKAGATVIVSDERRSEMNSAEYLNRIGFSSPHPSPDLATLKSLQRSHMLAVPFENLDIHWQRPITLDINNFYAKIVAGRRGGFCYE